APAAAKPAAPAAAPATPAPTTARSSAPPAVPTPTGAPQKSSPAARQVAEARGVYIGAFQWTGRGGVVSKPDVLVASSSTQPAAAPATPAPSPAPSGPPALRSAPVPAMAGERETRERLSTRRKRIAENLLQSHLATAHLTTFNEIDMSAVSSLRERVKEKIEKQHGVRLSFMPFFVRAACIALRDYPVVNAQMDGDEIIYKNYVNMGIAVASEQGLVVPN